MPLFETSAKDDSEVDHVEAIFLTLAHKLKNSKPMMPPTIAGYGYKAGQNRTVAIEESRGSEDGAGNGCGC